MINYRGLTPAELGITHENITKYDKLRFYDIRTTNGFDVYGLYDYKKEGPFSRIPDEIANKLGEEVLKVNHCTAGGRIRFETTSQYLAIRTKSPAISYISQYNTIATAGFDLYIHNGIKDEFVRAFTPYNPMRSDNGMCEIQLLPFGRKKITVNLPLFQEISEIYIGLDSDAELAPHLGYRNKKPILFYGSSAVQGLGASRPGLAFTSQIARSLDSDYINLGFADCCRGDADIGNFITTIDPSVFVYCYGSDSSASELRERHESFYKMFRAVHPETPTIIVDIPDYLNYSGKCEQDYEHRTIMMETYNNAVSRGENVIYIDGYSAFSRCGDDVCTLDLFHYNDVGMTIIAEVLCGAVEYALSKARSALPKMEIVHPQ